MRYFGGGGGPEQGPKDETRLVLRASQDAKAVGSAPPLGVMD